MDNHGRPAVRVQDFSLWDKLRAKGAPLSFDLEITARCPNDCRHCYINLPAADMAARQRELSLREIDGIGSEAVALGAVWCLITGGEPLLRPDFPDIYLALKRKGLLVSIFTTAGLISEKHVRLFREYPPRDIEVTVYGVTEETYDRVTRTRGSFAKFQRGLDRLLSAGLKIRLKTVALRSNAAELPQIAQFCRARTKDYFRFDPFLHLRFDGDEQRNNEIRNERLSPAEIVELEQADEARYASLRNSCSDLICPELANSGCNHLFHCGAGASSFNVSYDGLLRLCSSLWHPDCTYDLRTGSLTDAWRNFVPKVRDMRSDRKEFLESCRRCEIINLCMWCPAHAHLESGGLDAGVPYFCAVANARHRAIRPSG
jgi:radical SAM protein with 4Fe4S-binding SPASM domain